MLHNSLKIDELPGSFYIYSEAEAQRLYTLKQTKNRTINVRGISKISNILVVSFGQLLGYYAALLFVCCIEKVAQKSCKIATKKLCVISIQHHYFS